MFTWRAKKQLSIILVLAVVVGGVGAFLFLKLYFVPGCFDNTRNQGEEDIDCGGPCISCAVRRAKPIEVFWARGVGIRPHVYDVAAFVENQNEVLVSPTVDYEFTLLNDAGEMVAQKTGRTFIFPQERTYVIESAVETTGEAKKVEFRVLNADWRVSTAARPNLIVERRAYRVAHENGTAQSIIDATILNRTALDFRQFEVRFAVFDQSGNLIGTNRVVGETLLSGAHEDIKSIWPQEFVGEAATIDVEARVNIFDPFVILQPQ